MSQGYFSSPYEFKALKKLASSSDPLDRWEAANALADLDEITASKILAQFSGEKDPLVLAALAQFSSKMPVKDRQPGPKPRKAQGSATGLSDTRPQGKFWIAFSQSLGPLKISRLASDADITARKALAAKDLALAHETTFPQANSIAKAMEMLDQIIELRAVHASKLGLQPRQVLYYLNALRFAGFVSMPSKNEIKLADSLASAKTDYQRIRLVIVKFLSIPTVAAAYLGLTSEGATAGPDVPRNFQELVSFFGESNDAVGISGSTVGRRAETAVSWARQIAQILNRNIATGDQWPSA